MRTFSALSFTFGVIAAGCGEPSPGPAALPCAALRERSIELALVAHAMPPDLAAAHRAQLATALAEDYDRRCIALTAAQLDCELAAGSLDELTACAGGTP